MGGGGDAAQAALAAGLVDRFSTRDEWRARLIEAVGIASDDKEPRSIDLDDYLLFSAEFIRRARLRK